MKIRMLVDGHSTQKYDLVYAKNLLRDYQAKGCLIVDDETRQLAKIESLKEDSRVTVWPMIRGG